jgi:hypothetical protein
MSSRTGLLSPRYALAGVILAAVAVRADDGWRPLFDGRDFEGWTTFMAAPPPETDVPGLKRDDKGNYLEPIGSNRDPLHVFTIETVDGGPAIHVSGAGFGVMTTNETFANFCLRMQVKWGEKKWGYKRTTHAALDAGLLYYARGPAGIDHLTWPRCLEFQIQEKDFGDLFALGMTEATGKAHIVPDTINGHPTKSYFYDPNGAPTVFVARAPIGNRLRRIEDMEQPHGEWNTLDLVCLGDSSIHIVNGKVVNRLYHARIPDGSSMATLDSGQICLQTEGGEVYYRDIEVRPITAIPAEYAEKTSGLQN